MTEKAQRILDRMNRKKRKSMKPWSRMSTDHAIRDKALDEFNQSTLDQTSPVGAPDQQMRVLQEINELQEFENDNWSRGSL